MSATARTRRSVRKANKRMRPFGPTLMKAKYKLSSQTSSLKRAKMAAVRQIANATTAGFLGIEKKFLDTARADTVVASVAALTGGEYDPTTGCTGCLSCPAEGDNEQSRDGKRFVIDSLILKGYVRTAQETGQAPSTPIKVFVAVVLDTTSNGAQMSSEDCFKNLLGTTLGVVDVTKNLLSGNRYRILKSQVFDVTPVGIAAAGATVAHYGIRRDFDWYIPFKGGLRVSLKDGDANSGKNADVANVVDNSLHVIAFATDADCAIGYNACIRFQG